MHPSVHFGRRSLSAYRLAVGSALVLFYVGMGLGADSARLEVLPTLTATALVAVSAIVGGRALFVVTHTHGISAAVRDFRRGGSGGASSHGGAIAALAVGAPLVLALGLPLAQTADIAGLAWVPAMVAGRLGCWMHGCCRGRRDPRFERVFGAWAGRHAGRVPFPLLDIATLLALSVAGAAMSVAVSRGVAPTGCVFLLMTAGYAAARLGSDRFRDSVGSRRPADRSLVLVRLAWAAGCLFILGLQLL